MRNLPQFRSIPELLEGRIVPSSKRPSLFLFATKKAGSSFVGQLLQDIAIEHDLIPVDLDGFVHQTKPEGPLDQLAGEPRSYALRESEQLSSAARVAWNAFFGACGCLYGPHRDPGYLDRLDSLEDRRILIMLRDPRDALTSLYFSRAFGSAPPVNPARRANFQGKRSNARTMSIDEYVLAESKLRLRLFERFCDCLRDHPDCALIRYEEMVTNFPLFLRQVFAFWCLPLDPAVLARFERRADFHVVREDVYAHKRQVAPGDHRRTLRPATIETLTDRFAPVLAFLGYDAGGSLLPPRCRTPRVPEDHHAPRSSHIAS